MHSNRNHPVSRKSVSFLISPTRDDTVDGTKVERQNHLEMENRRQQKQQDSFRHSTSPTILCNGYSRPLETAVITDEENEYIDCAQGSAFQNENRQIRDFNFHQSKQSIPKSSLKRGLVCNQEPERDLGSGTCRWLGEEPLEKVTRSSSNLLGRFDHESVTESTDSHLHRSPDLPPTPPSPLFSGSVFTRSSQSLRYQKDNSALVSVKKSSDLFGSSSSTSSGRGTGSSNNENENPVTGQGKRQPRLQPSGYSSTWLNCSSNYQTLFDLSSSSVAACRPDQTLFEGHRGQNLEDRQEADYCIPENSDQKLADNDTYLVNNSTKCELSPDKRDEAGGSFGSHSSEVSSATTTSGQQHISAFPTTNLINNTINENTHKQTIHRSSGIFSQNSQQKTRTENFASKGCQVPRGFGSEDFKTSEQFEWCSFKKRPTLVDILISPAKKRFNFSFRQNKVKDTATETCISCSNFGSFRCSHSQKFFQKSPKKEKSNTSLGFPRETKFSITTFSSPEPETFVLKMKLKEKLKPRSLSTSGRAGSKKSSEFSELHFGRKPAGDSDLEDDGGFSQFQELQQSFFNRRGRGSDSGQDMTPGGNVEYQGGPVATITRRVRSVVDKPGSTAGKHGKDHSDCAKCNKAQPDLFQTMALHGPGHGHDHGHGHKRTPSGDVWDGMNGGQPGGGLGGGNRPRYASESNLLRAPLKPMTPYAYSILNKYKRYTVSIDYEISKPSVQNVNYPNGAAPSGMRRPLGSHGAGVPQGTLGGPNSGPCNTCYVQWGTEVKKLSLPLANPPYFDENSGTGGGDQDRTVALSNMRELFSLLVSLFPIAVTEDDLSSKRKVIYIKDENTGIFYELEDITDVKPRCFLSIRDYSAATATLPHPGGKTPTGGQGIYDKADGSRGVDGLGRLGSNSGRQPLKLSVFQPVAPSGRTDGRGSAPLVHPKATGGSQPAGLDQLSSEYNNRDRSSSFLTSTTTTTNQNVRSTARSPGVQTLGRNFSSGPGIKPQTQTRTLAQPRSAWGGLSPPSSTEEQHNISQRTPDGLITPEADSDVFMAKTPPGVLDGSRGARGTTDQTDVTMNSREFNDTTNSSVVRELVDKSSTIIIKDSANAENSAVNTSKLDHIELQLGDLTHLVNSLISSQRQNMSDGKENDSKQKDVEKELETLERLKLLFEQQLQSAQTQREDTSNNMSSSNVRTTHITKHHNQFISTAHEKSKITFDQLCSLREKVRHLRLELNQLKRAHANQVTASQLMIRDASQKICSAIEAFSQHAKKEEEARGKRTSALAQAWALHLATLDKLESEISEMEVMVERMRTDADYYAKHGITTDGGVTPEQIKATWDRRVEQLTHSVQDTGILISKVKVDLLEFETQMHELVRLGGAVGEGQKRLLKDGPERLALFIERIRQLNSQLSQLKQIEIEQSRQVRELYVEELARPQSTPPEVPLHLNIHSPSESERLSILGMGGPDSRSSSLKRGYSRKQQNPQQIKVSTSTASNRYLQQQVEGFPSSQNLQGGTAGGSSLSLNNKSRSYGSLLNANMYPSSPGGVNNTNTSNSSYSHWEQHVYSTNRDGKGTTTTTNLHTSGGSGGKPEKEKTELEMLMTDLDAFSPSVPNLAAHHGTTSSTNRQTRNSASQVKRKRAESSREQQQQNKSKDEYSGSILDTAYATDRDSKEVIRKQHGTSGTTTGGSTTQTTTTRTVNRETVIDDYYSTVHQLQRTNREQLLSSSSRHLADQDDETQRCRTDLVVGANKNLQAGSSLSSLIRSPSPTGQHHGPPQGGSGTGQHSPQSTTTSNADKAKQVTTYTYYTITKDGQKKTIYGGKQQKVVPPEDQNL
ncbi:uncharacterized protein LOC142342551 isoform X2 [Convolutriloba macropyga]|uniref:uncharacterized protein LOC142342551 isoform X2 n=1 Tax=Convolutriloba macropyga TaxID=536237 RepID=UPI003F520451